MSGINWHNLQLTLLRGGVAPKYARRTITELRQHHADLVQGFIAGGVDRDEAVAKADRDIGDSQTIAREVLAKRELQTWAHRFPLLVFLAAPIIGYPVLFLALFFSTVVLPIELFAGREGAAQPLADGVVTLLYCALFVYIYLLAPLFLAALSIFSRKRTTQLLWPTLAIVIIAFLSSGLSFNIAHSPMPGESSLGLTWGYRFLGVPVSSGSTMLGLLRMVATIALCGACMYFYRPLEPRGMDTASSR